MAISMDNRHVLEIRHERQVYVYNPPITVSIDGRKCGSIGNGETVRVQLDDGPHVVELSASFRSRRVEICMNKDAALSVKWGRISGRILTSLDECFPKTKTTPPGRESERGCPAMQDLLLQIVLSLLYLLKTISTP